MALATCALVAAALAQSGGDAHADTILMVRSVWTGTPDAPRAEAVAIRGGKILAVGGKDAVMKVRGPNTVMIDRPDRVALPGFIDAHGHLSMLGAMVDELDLRGLTSPAAVAARVAERSAQQQREGWILGRSWDQSLWADPSFPTASMLDEAAPDRPVWLKRVDGHAGWANREAMRRAGVTRDTPVPPGGRILRDANGEPTGVFVDEAMDLVTRHIPAPSKADLERRLLAAQDECLRVGLTTVHDAGLDAAAIAVLRDLDARGRLRMRVYGMALPDPDRPIDILKVPPAPPRPDGRFELRAIKLFIDGAMGSRGALLFEPYSDDPGHVGLGLLDPEELRVITEAALLSGWQVCTHAIGDRGNALVLDAYAAALKATPRARDPRLRIEHAQVLRKQDVARLGEFGIIASIQPSHASTDQRWADARLGAASERVQGAYAWRWLVDAGVRLALGSDFPVEEPNPFWGLYAAITRQDVQGNPPGGWHPEQRLTLEEALTGYTQGSAYAMFAEDRLGRIAEGFLADIILVDRDPFAVGPRELLETNVTHTMVGGRFEFEHEP